MSRHFTRTGECRQKFTIKIDIDLLLQDITNKIFEIAESEKMNYIELDEYYADVDKLIITGMYETPYEWTHYNATLYDPPEDDIERDYIGDLNKFIPKEYEKYITRIETEEDEDDAEYM